MGAKLDDRLNAVLAGTGGSAQDGALSVIVTLRDDADVSAFAAEGLDIAHRYESICAVSGTIRAADLKALENDGAVVRVEFDGEMHALGA